MRKVTASYLASLLGHPVNRTLSSIGIDHITIDSRTCSSSSLFVALKGATLDGHDFIENAIHMGSKLILASRKEKERVQKYADNNSVYILYVENPLSALQLMAKRHISKASSLQKVGITGSVGKTTTKEILSSILSGKGSTAKTIGNYNSEIGLAISAFEIDQSSAYSVFEMGVDHVGEMSTMVDIYSPDIALITNIGLSHIGKMGSLSAIALEKGNIFHSSIIHPFMEEGSAWQRFISKKQQVAIKSFGFKSMPYISHMKSRNLDGWSFTYKGEDVHFKGIGTHTLLDAFGAIKIAETLGASVIEIVEGLQEYTAMSGRSNVRHGKVTIIEDWYNSSVDSTSQILKCVKSAPCNGEKRIVLGSMKEMGTFTKTAHNMVARNIRNSGLEHIYLYGEEMYTTYSSLRSYRDDKSLFFTDDWEKLQSVVLEDTRKGDLVLLKGSRMMAMERLVPAISSIR